MKFLYGMHDPGGEHLFADAKGWIVFTEAIGHEPNDRSGRDYRQWSDAGYGVLVRLNNGYGTAGTIPAPEQHGRFAVRVANFIANSKGCDTWIIGNEPNHSQEWPDGETIRAAHYINCFKAVHQEVRVQNGARHALIPAPVAPWNLESGDWLEYHKSIWSELWQLAGGVAIHAYTHGPSPSLITSEERVQGWHWHFRTYRDQLSALPGQARGLPVYITESNQGDNAWVDANTGWVQAAYDEIDRWNQQGGNQKIYCLCLYRWPAYDRWGIVDKPGVHQDLRAAIGRGLSSPAGNTNVMPQTPSTSTNTQAAPALPREWDERLTQRGVTVETPPLQPGDKYWRVTRARWFNEQESQGRHHIYVEALSSDDGPLRLWADVPFLVQWPSGQKEISANGRGGFDAANFPMSASLNEFSIRGNGHYPSETVKGIGMGANGNPGIHTSTLVTFQLATAPAQTTQTHIPAVTKPVSSGPQPGDTWWEDSLAFVRRWEGGFVHHPSDPGGATNKGITIGTFIRWRTERGQPTPSVDDLRAITDAEVEQIYFEWYWKASGADRLPWPLCLAHFDTAVNAGVGRAAEMMQLSKGDFLAYMGHLMSWYTRIQGFEHFGRAWIRRRAEILLEASQ